MHWALLEAGFTQHQRGGKANPPEDAASEAKGLEGAGTMNGMGNLSTGQSKVLLAMNG